MKRESEAVPRRDKDCMRLVESGVGNVSGTSGCSKTCIHPSNLLWCPCRQLWAKWSERRNKSSTIHGNHRRHQIQFCAPSDTHSAVLFLFSIGLSSLHIDAALPNGKHGKFSCSIRMLMIETVSDSVRPKTMCAHKSTSFDLIQGLAIRTIKQMSPNYLEVLSATYPREINGETWKNKNTYTFRQWWPDKMKVGC